ncbi:MAG TPA: aminomethyl-transferring glycine dehydrogenase subunit GcvPA [Candidatus Polarisedimenticolia bacterium]|nr:aminomethyl-transferring glycine dehydrogenase subunit GcvPA [Candidatus Polarisedimenticolia bacterium]
MRYIPSSPEERGRMLRTIGVDTIEKLFESIPSQWRLDRPLDLPPPAPEQDLVAHLRDLSRRNLDPDESVSFLGAGAYRHFIPAVVDHLLSRSEFYSSYTPYQPEVSQGTLQAIFEFQTLICQLASLDVANASLYDGASALAEGILLAHRARRRRRVVALETVHPEYLQTSRTLVSAPGMEIETIPAREDGAADLRRVAAALDGDTAALVVQQPNFLGRIEEIEPLAEAAHAAGALLVVVVAEAVSLGLLKGPGEQGADVVLGEAQSFGIPLSFGGPYLGFMAVRSEHLRDLPGRLVGQARDSQGRTGYVLTLATREQHIRREKATSNICTNEGLCALAASIFLATVGKRGLRELAEQNRCRAEYARESLSSLPGCRLPHPGPLFNEFVLEFPREALPVHGALLKKGIVAGLPLSRYFPDRKRDVLLCFTELSSRLQIDRLVKALREAL